MCRTRSPIEVRKEMEEMKERELKVISVGFANAFSFIASFNVFSRHDTHARASERIAPACGYRISAALFV